MPAKRKAEPPPAPPAPTAVDPVVKKSPAAAAADDAADTAVFDVPAAAPPDTHSDVFGNMDRKTLAIIALLRKFGFGDFRHDFNEQTATRDLIMADDLKRFMEILQRYSVDSRVNAKATFLNNYKGKTLYGLLRGQIGAVLYPNTQKTDDPAQDPHEEEIMKDVGLDYPKLKNAIRKLPVNDRTIKEGFENIRLGATTKRAYTIRAQTYKYILPPGRAPPNDPQHKLDPALKGAKAPENTRNLSSLFMDVTGGKTKFALIIDATGGLSTTSFSDGTLWPQPMPGITCDFLIINNLENDADSADKLKKLSGKGERKPTIGILRDLESTVVYPVWTEDEQAHGANIFSGVRIIMNRTGDGQVEADMFFPNEIDMGGKKIPAGTTYNIGDLSETSNVKNATLNAVAALMMEPNHPGKPFLFALIKRMGDWCQALSLLDRSRPYKIVSSGKDDRFVTLTDLVSEGYEIGLVTNDRILLAYSLMLGLNVFFTSGSDISSLIYFKNNSDIQDETKLPAQFPRLDGEITQAMKVFTTPGDKDGVLREIEAAYERIASVSIQEYTGRALIGATNRIADLFRQKGGMGVPVGQDKNTWHEEFGSTVGQAAATLLAYNAVVSNLGSLRNGYLKMKAELEKVWDLAYGEGGRPRDRFAAKNQVISICSNFAKDEEYNKGVLERLDACSFAESAAKETFIRTMITKIARTGTDPTGNVKNMVLGMRDDFLQLANSGMFSVPAIIQSIPSYGGFPEPYKTYAPMPIGIDMETNVTLRDIYKSFINTIILLHVRLPPAPPDPAAPAAADMAGGGASEVKTAYDALRQFKVRLSNGVSTTTDGALLDSITTGDSPGASAIRADILDSVREVLEVDNPILDALERRSNKPVAAADDDDVDAMAAAPAAPAAAEMGDEDDDDAMAAPAAPAPAAARPPTVRTVGTKVEVTRYPSGETFVKEFDTPENATKYALTLQAKGYIRIGGRRRTPRRRGLPQLL